MKKIIYSLICLWVLGVTNSKAQITLEHTYDYYRKFFFVTDIGNNEYKYVIQDSLGFSLYNLDHSLYLNVVSPIPLNQSPSYYEIAYITKSLFDCDSTNIEYVITAPTHMGNFYVFRTDGTLLFERDSVKGPYCFGCATGSIWQQPIFNTSNGAKLLLFSNLPDSQGGYADSISVYSLCGTAPTFIRDVSSNESFVKLFPNPTYGMLNFEIMPPNNQEKFKLAIYDSELQLIEEADINGKRFQFDLNKRSLSSGMYFYDLRTENKIFQTGKFIISH